MIAAAYEQAFKQAQMLAHPEIAGFESSTGYAIDRERLEHAARVLACPVKVNPANWQHGRVIYALTRAYLQEHRHEVVHLLDIGTAKGFSALCLQWALNDSDAIGTVISVDVIDPKARIARNTIVECDGLKTLAEILAPWPEARAIEFVQGTGRQWLTGHPERVHLAVVDGKHTYDEVSWEAALLAARQSAGDAIFFDDVQIEGISKAVKGLWDTGTYDVQHVAADVRRRYAIARKR